MSRVKRIKGLPTIGGKSRLLQTLLPIIEYVIWREHIVGFLDLFGGGNKFIPQLGKSYLPIRIYNDIDLGIANLMACLADWRKAQQVIDLAYRLQYEIKTKEAFDKARNRRRSKETSEIESAALTIIVAEFSRAADRKTFLKENAERGISWNRLQRYKELTPYLCDAVITCGNYDVLFERYSHRSDFLAFLDPPYVGTDCYEDYFSREDHEKMVRLICRTNMKTILCGTANDIYSILEKEFNWNRYFVGEIPRSSSGKKGERQHEYIWTNFSLPLHLVH